MVPTAVFDTYWHFAAERQAIFYRRLHDCPGPLTTDPVLRAYRFTNAYRVLDRVSQYLIREVQYRPDRVQQPQEIFFRTVLFKVFNRIDTWEAIEARVGPITWRTTSLDKIKAILDDRHAHGLRNYSPAYIMPSPPFNHARKHANHLALIARMMDDRLPDRLRQSPSLRSVYERLLTYPGFGPFLAFQAAIDLNYSDLLDFDENEFVVAGPGALDGIAKCFTEIDGRPVEQIIEWMVEHQDREFDRLGLTFQALPGRKLHPIDCQNLFCEISKYARVAHPEVAGTSGRLRIKQLYRPSTEPIPSLAFPPKWAITAPTSLQPRRTERQASLTM
jgi:hypothetical protein